MPGGNAASFGSGSSSNSRGGLNQRVKCNCGRDDIVRTVRNGPNVEMRFHGCPLWPERGCEFFKWVAGSNEIDDLRYQVLEKDTNLVEMEYEKKLMEEKIKKLQVKRENLEEEIQDMKLEISQILKLTTNSEGLVENCKPAKIGSKLMLNREVRTATRPFSPF